MTATVPAVIEDTHPGFTLQEAVPSDPTHAHVRFTGTALICAAPTWAAVTEVRTGDTGNRSGTVKPIISELNERKQSTIAAIASPLLEQLSLGGARRTARSHPALPDVNRPSPHSLTHRGNGQHPRSGCGCADSRAGRAACRPGFANCSCPTPAPFHHRRPIASLISPFPHLGVPGSYGLGQ